MLSDEVQKGLKTLQREFAELVGAFTQLALQIKELTRNMQTLAVEVAILKHKMEDKDGHSRNEERVEGSGKEEG